MPSRRTFLLSSVAAVTSATLPQIARAERQGGPTFSEASLGAYTQGLLTQPHFESLVGSLFMAFLEDDEVAYMRLTSVKPVTSPHAETSVAGTPKMTSAAKTDARSLVTSFALVFNTGGVRVPQGSYLLDHATLGRFTVFLVEGLDEKGRQACSATFSQVPAAARLG